MWYCVSFAETQSSMNSPVADDSGTEAGKEKSRSESPVTLTTVHSKLQPSPLSQSSNAHKASPQKPTTSSSPPAPANSSSTLLNGNKRSQVSDTASSPTPTSAPPPKKRRVSRSTSPTMQKARTKVIISPVRCVTSTKVAASSGDSYSDSSLPSPVENGIPQQYLRDFKHNSKGRTKHHHHHRHHHRDRSSHHHDDRRHHRSRREEEGDRDRGRRGGAKDYQSSSSSSSSGKSRRTEQDRYR